MSADVNHKTYNNPAVVALYAKMEELQPYEAAIFQRWIKLQLCPANNQV